MRCLEIIFFIQVFQLKIFFVHNGCHVLTGLGALVESGALRRGPACLSLVSALRPGVLHVVLALGVTPFSASACGGQVGPAGVVRTVLLSAEGHAWEWPLTSRGPSWVRGGGGH